eukprot:3324860-Amphidinium_carterae.1
MSRSPHSRYSFTAGTDSEKATYAGMINVSHICATFPSIYARLLTRHDHSHRWERARARHEAFEALVQRRLKVSYKATAVKHGCITTPRNNLLLIALYLVKALSAVPIRCGKMPSQPSKPLIKFIGGTDHVHCKRKPSSRSLTSVQSKIRPSEL